MHEVLHAHILDCAHESSGSAGCERQCSCECNLKHELAECHVENMDLRQQVRHYHDELDDMHHRQYNDCEDCCKWPHTSTE